MKGSLYRLITATIGIIAALALVSCGEKPSGGVSPQMMADAIHTVLEADRTVYTRLIVNRLANEEKVITGSYNFSKNANEKNDENILIIENEKIALEYMREFRYLYYGSR